MTVRSDPATSSTSSRIRPVRVAATVAWAVLVVTVRPAALPLIVLYPVIDIVFTLVTSRVTRRPVGAGGWVSVGLDVLAVVGMLLATALGFAAVFLVFAIWASVAGLVQLLSALAVRRQAALDIGDVLSGAVSTVVGLAFVGLSATPFAIVPLLAAYAFTGAVFSTVGAISARRSARRISSRSVSTD